MDGAILIDKPAGLSSGEVVRRVKHHLKPDRIGHAGTLDPFATGLLILLLGKATRLQEMFLTGNKSYTGQICLGKATDTDDITGTVIEEQNVSDLRKTISQELLSELAARFLGVQEQIPPQYSAIKVGGVRSYARARQGEGFTLKARTIEIHSLDLAWDAEGNSIDFSVSCSKGTYIRSLARDIGVALNIPACLSELRRTGSEPYTIEQSVSLEALLSQPVGESTFVPINELVRGLPQIEFSPFECERLRLGDQSPLKRYGGKEFRLNRQVALINQLDQTLCGIAETASPLSQGELRVRCIL